MSADDFVQLCYRLYEGMSPHGGLSEYLYAELTLAVDLDCHLEEAHRGVGGFGAQMRIESLESRVGYLKDRARDYGVEVS